MKGCNQKYCIADVGLYLSQLSFGSDKWRGWIKLPEEVNINILRGQDGLRDESFD